MSAILSEIFERDGVRIVGINMKRGLSTMQEPEDTRSLIRYLLGDLNEAEQDKIEERYASDDSFYFKILATEDELIDSYVMGEISQEDRAKFEQAYLTNPHRLKKVESNKIFLELVTNRLSPVPWYQHLIHSLQRTLGGQHVRASYSFATLLLGGILFSWSGWLLWDRVRMRGELAQVNSQWNQKEDAYEREIAALKQRDTHAPPQPSPRSSPQEVGSQGPNHVKAHGWSSIVGFVVPRGGVRAPTGEPKALKPLVILRGATVVRLTVDIQPNDYSEYRVSLQKIQKIDEPDSWSRTLSKDQPGFSTRKIVVNVPADYFENQDYVLKVTAFDPQGEQILALRNFTVINENLARANRTR